MPSIILSASLAGCLKALLIQGINAGNNTNAASITNVIGKAAPPVEAVTIPGATPIFL